MFYLGASLLRCLMGLQNYFWTSTTPLGLFYLKISYKDNLWCIFHENLLFLQECWACVRWMWTLENMMYSTWYWWITHKMGITSWLIRLPLTMWVMELDICYEIRKRRYEIACVFLTTVKMTSFDRTSSPATQSVPTRGQLSHIWHKNDNTVKENVLDESRTRIRSNLDTFVQVGQTQDHPVPCRTHTKTAAHCVRPNIAYGLDEHQTKAWLCGPNLR